MLAHRSAARLAVIVVVVSVAAGEVARVVVVLVAAMNVSLNSHKR